MSKVSIDRLSLLCERIPALLYSLSEDDFCRKASPEKWSKKQILGHLLDSATNNHHRFIRTQIENIPAVTYHQNKWNDTAGYQQFDRLLLIEFWTSYNKFLVEIIKGIPSTELSRLCQTENKVSLHWLIDDYVNHLEHHLRQLVDYDF